ncbi:MAG: Hint domain-containing protein, partial [Pseudomonadota bacterium]
MPVYSVGIIQFDDLSPAFSTSDTTGGQGGGRVGETYSVSASAVPIALVIEDDDLDFDDGFIDPPGNSTGTNNQLLAEPVTVNGTAYGPAVSGDPPAGQVELEFAFTTTDGDTYYVVRIAGVNVGLSGPVLPQPGQTFAIASVSDGQDDLYSNVPCFVRGTLIETLNGYAPIENLKPGDVVVTADAGPQPLRWLGRMPISLFDQIINPSLRPIVFSKGVLGNERELRLSPLHRVLVTDWRAELLYGAPEVLV